MVEDNDSVDEVFDQVSLLLEGERIPALAHSLQTLISATAAVGFSFLGLGSASDLSEIGAGRFPLGDDVGSGLLQARGRWISGGCVIEQLAELAVDGAEPRFGRRDGDGGLGGERGVVAAHVEHRSLAALPLSADVRKDFGLKVVGTTCVIPADRLVGACLGLVVAIGRRGSVAAGLAPLLTTGHADHACLILAAPDQSCE